MIPVFKREFRSYFCTPLGYVFLAAYYLFTGFFFFNYNLYGNSSDLRSLFAVLFTVNLFLIPILTMRLLSEERKMKTDQLLLMAPVGSGGIVLGKFLAALAVYTLAVAGALGTALIIEASGGDCEWPVTLGHLAGLFLLGSALIGAGLFISSLTENQIIAAIGGYCVSFFMMLLDSLAGMAPSGAASEFIKAMSFRVRYQSFTLGIFGVDHVIFFISVSVFFVFLAAEQFEKRRWN
ncbi:MAG: ABC transporter permease subunit [Treponema sp.]|nr:ABC transporter permease subunit [Treponema sp.]